MDDRPITMANPANTDHDVDDLSSYIGREFRGRHADSVSQIVDVHTNLDHSSATEVVQCQHPVTEGPDQAVD